MAMVKRHVLLVVCVLAGGWWSPVLGQEGEVSLEVDPREGCARWMGGVPGTPGLGGLDGRDGREGRPGETGDAGHRGWTGERGEPGHPGDEGVQGLRGFPGFPGAQGQGGESALSYHSAFSMGLRESTAATDVPILFTKEFYNEQHHFDDLSGKFRCFIPGLYYFTFHLTVQGKGVRVGLYRNGRVVTLTLDQYLTSDLDQTSGGTVLSLTHGDQVWLQVYSPGTEGEGGVYADVTNDSTFSGFLLQPRPPASPLDDRRR